MQHRLDDFCAFLRKLNREDFYGDITIKFQRGRIVHAEKKEVISCKNGEDPDKKPK